MSSWFITLIIAVGITAWVYGYLARNNGNANPGSNFALAAVAGTIFFIVVFTFLKFVIHF